jgi:hypothetical protein
MDFTNMQYRCKGPGDSWSKYDPWAPATACAFAPDFDYNFRVKPFEPGYFVELNNGMVLKGAYIRWFLSAEDVETETHRTGHEWRRVDVIEREDFPGDTSV